MKQNCDYCKSYKAKFVPRNKCLACWSVYFLKHPGEVVSNNSVVRIFGRKRLVATKGDLYVKMFERFQSSYKAAKDAGLV